MDYDNTRKINLQSNKRFQNGKIIQGFPNDIQRGPKVASLVARSSRVRCAQHLRRIRRCDVQSGAYVTQMLPAKFAYDLRHVARVHHADFWTVKSMKICETCSFCRCVCKNSKPGLWNSFKLNMFLRYVLNQEQFYKIPARQMP
jgi:hypothetical protein